MVACWPCTLSSAAYNLWSLASRPDAGAGPGRRSWSPPLPEPAWSPCRHSWAIRLRNLLTSSVWKTTQCMHQVSMQYSSVFDTVTHKNFLRSKHHGESSSGTFDANRLRPHQQLCGSSSHSALLGGLKTNWDQNRDKEDQVARNELPQGTSQREKERESDSERERETESAIKGIHTFILKNHYLTRTIWNDSSRMLAL